MNCSRLYCFLSVIQALLLGCAPLWAEEPRRRNEAVERTVRLFEKTNNSMFIQMLSQMKVSPEEVLPHYAKWLSHTDVDVRCEVFLGLAKLGEEGSALQQHVLQAFMQDEKKARLKAGIALIALGTKADPAIPILAEYLQKKEDAPTRDDNELRCQALTVLKNVGSKAITVLPIVDLNIENADVLVAYTAFLAAGVIRNEPPLDKAVLENNGVKVFSGAESYRSFVILKTGTLEPEKAITLLNSLLCVPDVKPHLYLMGIITLGEMKPRDTESVSNLLKAIASKNSTISTFAVRALEQCTIDSKDSIAKLSEAIWSDNPALKLQALKALKRGGSYSIAAIPTVVETLKRAKKGTDPELIEAHLDVLRALGPKASDAAPILNTMLPLDAPIYQGLPTHAVMDLRKYLLTTLADIGPTVESIPAIVEELSSPGSPWVAAAAAKAAGKLQTDQEQIVPFLKKFLEHPKDAYSTSAVTLDIMGMRLFSPDDNMTWTSVRLEAIRALARMGPKAKSALELLRERAKDSPPPSLPSNLHYQEEAAKAVELISK